MSVTLSTCSWIAHLDLQVTLSGEDGGHPFLRQLFADALGIHLSLEAKIRPWLSSIVSVVSLRLILERTLAPSPDPARPTRPGATRWRFGLLGQADRLPAVAFM